MDPRGSSSGFVEKSIFFEFDGNDQVLQTFGQCFLELPYPLKPPPGTFFAIAAELTILNLPRPPIWPFFKIQVDELRDEYCPSHEQKVLCTVPNIHGTTNVVYNNEQTIFTRLEGDEFHKLSIRILNSEDQVLKLCKERKSFMVVKICAMSSNNFYKLRVNGKMDYNTYGLSGLRAELPHEVNLTEKGNWSIALESLHIPNPKIQKMGATMLVQADGMEKAFSYNLGEFAHQMGEFQLFTRVKEHIESVTSNITLKLHHGDVIAFESWNQNTHKIYFSKALGFILGVSDVGIEKAAEPITIKYGHGFVLPLPMSMKRRPCDCVILKSDLIVSSILNKSFQHILRVIPVTSATDEYLHFEPKILEFHDVSPSAFKEILFQLTDEKGEIINFGNTNSLFMNLVLRHLK